jgi:hypothetical protein
MRNWLLSRNSGMELVDTGTPDSVRALDPEYLRHPAARAYGLRREIGAPQRA